MYFLYSYFLGSQQEDTGLCFVDALPFSCLLGFLLWFIVAVGWLRSRRSWSAGGTCDVVLMVVPTQGRFFGEHFWGMVGVMGCLWRVSPTPLGQAKWRDVLLYQSSFGWVFPWQSLPWMEMPSIRRTCSFGGRVVVAWLSWFCGRPLVGVRWMCGRCGAYIMWVGVFSLFYQAFTGFACWSSVVVEL